jgi:hypothetical protein
MNEQELKKARIDQAADNLERAESLVDSFSNDQSEEYFTAMCDAIICEETYDQIIHYYGETVKATRKQAKITFDRRMRARYFQIHRIRNLMRLLKSDLHKAWDYDQVKSLQIQLQLIELTMELADKIRQANAFEFRTLLSISEIKE